MIISFHTTPPARGVEYVGVRGYIYSRNQKSNKAIMPLQRRYGNCIFTALATMFQNSRSKGYTCDKFYWLPNGQYWHLSVHHRGYIRDNIKRSPERNSTIILYATPQPKSVYYQAEEWRNTGTAERRN